MSTTTGTPVGITFFRGEDPLRASKLNDAFAERVWRKGDTMLGSLILWRDPILYNEAATKQYVDGIVNTIANASVVRTFNGRQGFVQLTSGDVTTALTYTPYNVTNPAGYITAAQAAGSAPVQSVAGRTGAVTLTHVDITDWNATLAPYALLASPVFTGDARAVTPPPGDNDTSIATTAFVATALAGSVSGVSSFNTRTGAVVLTSADVTTALTYTPYNATNPAGYITSAGVPVASSSLPIMDSTATIGVGTTWARADHVHPSDTSRATVASLAGYLPLTGGMLTGFLTMSLSTYPQIIFLTTAGPLNQKRTVLFGDPNGSFSMQFNNDADNASNAFFQVTRSGYAPALMLLIAPTITLSGALTGINFGSVAVGSGVDLSKHINLFGDSYGFCITAASGGTLNYVTNTGGSHVFWGRSGAWHATITAGLANFAATIQSNNGRIISYNAGNNPSVFAYTTGSAGGFWAGADSNLYFGFGNGDGTPTTSMLQLTRAGTLMALSGDLKAFGAVFAGGTTDFGFFISGGSRVFNFAPSWYFDWNGSNGTLTWVAAPVGTLFYWRSDWVCYNNISWVGGHGPYVDVSDERGKRDIEQSTYGLDEILALNPISFMRVSKAKPNALTGKPIVERVEVGFSAQQVQPYIPEAVVVFGAELEDGTGGIDSDDPTLGLTTTPIVAALVNSVKTLTARIAELEARVH